MQRKSLIASASALALLAGLGLSAPAFAGGLEDYIDDGTGYDDTAPAATSDDFDPAPAPVAEAAEPEPEPLPVVTGPSLDDVSDAMLSEAPDTGCALPGEEDPEGANRATLDEIDTSEQIDPCLATASTNLNINDTNGPGGGGNTNNNGDVTQSVVSVNTLLGGALLGGNPNGEPIDSLLQVNLGTADRTSADAEGPALIEVNALEGILVGGDGEAGAVQLTVLDAINGDGTLLDAASLGPLDALGGLLAVGGDPAPGGLAEVENFDGLAELNLGADPDGPAGFNAIQANVTGEELPVAHVTLADGLDDGFDTVAAVQIGSDPEAGENPSVATAVVDNEALAGLLEQVVGDRVTVLDGADGGGEGLGALANVEGDGLVASLLSPLGTGDNGDGSDLTALDGLLEPLGLAGSGVPLGANQDLTALVNLSAVLDPVNGLLGGGLTGQGPLGAVTEPLQGLLTPVLGLLGGATPQ